MATTDKRLCAGVLPSTKGTLYTVPTGNYTIIKTITLCNTSASAVTIDLLLNNNYIISGLSLAAHDTLNLPLEQIIQAGELLEGLASTTSVISYYISGKEVSP